jgi:hypothetical protein
MEIIAGPMIESRPAQPYLAIGVVTPFRGMVSVRDRLWAELFAWLDRHRIASFGSAFMRLNVIDMRGPMDLEVGVLTGDDVLPGDDRVRPGAFPAGEYAALAIRNHTLRAHKVIGDWMDEQGREYDHQPDPAGDRFACRYELNLTDPRAERRKTRWVVQLNFLVRPQRALPA